MREWNNRLVPIVEVGRKEYVKRDSYEWEEAILRWSYMKGFVNK